MKTINHFLTILFFYAFVLQSQVPIKTSIFGQNAWLIDNTASDPSLNHITWSDVRNSGVKYVRVGGIRANYTLLYDFDNNPSSTTYLKILDISRLKAVINSIRINNMMEPIIQVAFDPLTNPGDCPTNQSPMTGMSIADQATVAGNLVAAVNSPQSGVAPVQYWIISNEPDDVIDCTNPKGFGYDGSSSGTAYQTDATSIGNYVKAFSTAMKGKDPIIKIIGPEIAGFGNDVTWRVNKIMKELVSPTSNTNSIMGMISSTQLYYVDYVSFHYYPDYSSSSSPRADVIADPTLTHDGFKNKLSSYVTSTYEGLVHMITTSGRNISNLKIACTEFNLADAQTGFDESTTGGQYNSMRDGNGNRSFLAGQWLSDIFSQAMNTYAVNPITHLNESWVEFMNFWSVKESGDNNTPCTDGKGYISNCGTTLHPYRSTYYHYQMLANYFKGTFYMGTVQSGKGDFKAFASKSCDGIYIMVLNQNTSTTINAAKINLNGTMPSTGSTQVGIQLGTSSNKVAPTTNILISHINPEETILIKCDPCGKPLSYKTYNKTMSAPDPFVNFSGYQRSCACLDANSYNTSSPQRCSNTDTSSITHPRIVAPGKLEISDSMWVPGIIRVPNGATLTINNAEVVFSSGAKIYTDPPTASSPGGQVIIMNSYLHGCDGANWQGITVTNHNDSGYVPLVIQQSTIHDALVAVHADSVTGMIITDSEISNGNTAMQLNYNKNFTINNNSIGEYATGIQTTNTMAGPSSISGNFITGVNTAISMLNDNHSGLTIGCNDFYNYTNYGVRSINCTLKNQGSLLQGAGNIFTSSSLLLNNKFSHSGNNITYYTDPSYPFTLVSGIGMNATSVLAQADGCGGSSRMANEEGQASTQINNTEDKPAILSTVPNPSTEQASIFFSLGKDNITGEIVLTNVFGEIISRYKVSAATNKIDIDCAKLANGIYFSSLLINGKIKDTKKMMIAR